LRSLSLLAAVIVAVGALPLRTAHSACGEECDSQYSSAIDDCRSQYGDDPADADDLTDCIQEAKDDYRSCLDDCASAAISLPPRWSLAGSPLPRQSDEPAALMGSPFRGRGVIHVFRGNQRATPFRRATPE
jgi:hypothetical protein